MEFIDWTLSPDCFLLHNLINEEYYQVIGITEKKDYHGLKVVTYVKNYTNLTCYIDLHNGFSRDGYRQEDYRPLRLITNKQKTQNILFQEMLKRLINIEELLTNNKTL